MDPLLIILIIVGTLGGISAAILYYLEKTKSDRIQNIRETKTISSENDAYNKVKSAQSISRILKRKGYDTSDVVGSLDEAEREIENGNYAEAKSLARDARSKMEQIKKGSPAVNKNSPEMEKKGYSVDEIEEIGFDKEKSSEREEEMKKQQERIQSLPDNYLESKFELNILEEKIKQIRDNEDAQGYFNMAKKYFDEGSYTDSLKYSVKCKKAIEGKGSGLLSGQRVDKKERDTSGIEDVIEEKIPELKETEEDIERKEGSRSETGIEISVKCPSCGYTADPEDRYCSKCGTELKEVYRCANCGNEVGENDNFCPKCGNELGITVFECPECGEEISSETEFCPSCGVEFE